MRMVILLGVCFCFCDERGELCDLGRGLYFWEVCAKGLCCIGNSCKYGFV